MLYSGFSELWCDFFRYKDNKIERLLLLKPIAEINQGLDKVLFNSVANEYGIEVIK